MDDSTNPAHPPAIKCIMGCFFFRSCLEDDMAFGLYQDCVKTFGNADFRILSNETKNKIA